MFTEIIVSAAETLVAPKTRTASAPDAHTRRRSVMR
jgi:hypothetical protein